MKQIKNLIENAVKKEVKTIDFTSYYASQEFSRKICEWNVYYIKTVKVPQEVSNYLNKNRILAGGAVLDLLCDKTPKDFDIFFIHKLPSKFLDRIRKNNEYYESINSITIKDKIQFIKRLYENANRVIGGFDLDACRFYMNHYGEIYGTATALTTKKNNNIIINPCCQSENFTLRIKKYYEKKFNIIHPHHIFDHLLFGGKYDYEDPPYEIDKHEDITISYILAGKAHKCSIINKPYSFKFLNKAMRNSIDEQGAEIYCYFIPEIHKNKSIYKIITKDIMTNVLREKYQDYLKITNLLLTNTSSQMTASFYPTNYKLSEIYPGIKFDILKDHLRAIFEIIRFGKMPRVVYYKIFRDYYDSLLFGYSQKELHKQN
jgi:hypothetical protein